MTDVAAPALSAPDATVLVLGVTPEVVQAGWPGAAALVAVDASPTIIDSMWRPNPRIASRAICAWWQDMPLADASIDAAAGDGSFNALADFADLPAVLREVHRVLRPAGTLLVRCFVRPNSAESLDDVAAAVLRGEFPHVAAFRMRLTFALAAEGPVVRLADVLAAFNRMFPDRDHLSRATGWPRPQIDMFDVDKGTEIRLNFPTLDQLGDAVAPWFDLRGTSRGTYTQAQHCPTLHLVRRD